VVSHYTCKTRIQVRVVAAIYCEFNREGNHSDVLINPLIAILCFLARKITAEHAEDAELFSSPPLYLLLLRLNSLFGILLGSYMFRVR
jgi:hypothetical protein